MSEKDYKKMFEELQTNLEELSEWVKKEDKWSEERKQGYLHLAKQVVDVCKRNLGTKPPPLPIVKEQAKIIAFRKRTHKFD